MGNKDFSDANHGCPCEAAETVCTDEQDKNEAQKASHVRRGCGSAAILVFFFFLCINLYDAISCFGGQAVDLPPVPFFLFSLWVAIRNVVGYTFLAVVPVFILGRMAKWVMIPALCYAVLIEVGVVYADVMYHASLSDVWQTLLMNTSVAEVKSFLKMSLTPLALGGALALAAILAGCSWLLAVARYPRVSRRSFACGCALLVPFLVLNVLTMNWHFGVAQMRYSNFVVSSYITNKRLKGIESACENLGLPARLSLDAELSKAPNVVFVLGESETRNNWHLYGYPRQTTPRMDALCEEDNGGICFRNLVGTQPATAEALCLMLTDVSFDCLSRGNWTLAEVYRRAGYRGVLISNNQYAGSKSAFSHLNRIFASCETKISVHDESPANENGKWWDAQAIPILRRELQASGDRPNLIFVHMAGVHYPVHDVNPKSEDYFSDSVDPAPLKGRSKRDRDRVNRYDNGIRYEDKVLGKLIDVVNENSRSPACVVFVSDHGESPRAPIWRDFESVETYEIPFVMWFSESYRQMSPDIVARAKKAADRPIQSDELTYGFVELGSITGVPNVKPRESFLHPDFKGRFPRLIDKGRLVYPPDRECATTVRASE